MQHLKRAEPVTNSLYIQRHEPYICNITDTFYNHSITNSICMQHLKRAAIHSSRAEPLGIVPRVNDFPPRSFWIDASSAGRIPVDTRVTNSLHVQHPRTLYRFNITNALPGLAQAALAQYLSLQESHTLDIYGSHEPCIDSTSHQLFLN